MRKSLRLLIIVIAALTICGAVAYAVTNSNKEGTATNSITGTAVTSNEAIDINKTIVSSTDKKYSYSDMVKDIEELTATYPEILKSEVVGKSVDSRRLYCLTLGNPDAEKQIFVTAGMHAREYINTPVVMKMIERYCKYYNLKSYKGIDYTKIFDKVCYIIMPMTNPDGIAISQYGPSAIRDEELRAKVKSLPRNGKYSNWKANANGVDINRNFTYYKKGKSEVTKPCSEKYPGKKAFNQPETRAVRDALAALSNPVAVINYHSMGQVIYWGYNDKSIKSECVQFKNLFASLTGYAPSFEGKTTATSGIGDFCGYVKNEYNIPYVCIENGTGGVPVSHSQFDTIYNKNKLGFAKAAYMYYTK